MAEVRYASGTSRGNAPDGWSQATVRQSGGNHRHKRGKASPPAGSAPDGPPSVLPRFTRMQLVLLEIAAGAAVAGLAGRKTWTIVGVAVGVVFAAASLIPLQRRWLYQVAGSRLRLAGRRRQQRRRTGLASLAGPYQVIDVATTGGSPIAVIRAGTSWALPMELRQDGIFNDDAGVQLGGLASLLTIEDVALASVRLINFVTPAMVPAGAPAGNGQLLARGATRYCVLTLDTIRAAAALGDRGGSDAAITQILRRCAMRAVEVLGNAQLSVQPLDETAAHRVLDSCLGPAAAVASPSAAATSESASGIRVGGTYSTTYVIGGSAADALRRLGEVAPYLGGRVVATALVFTPGHHRAGAECTLLLRVSTPADATSRDLTGRACKTLREAGLAVQRLGGEQGALLRATTPLGLTEGFG